jgi:NADPH:quinone reductase-like Zn-dependent oxidoreductase
VSVGHRVLGMADWHRDGTLAEYVAIDARNLAPLPGDVETAASPTDTTHERSTIAAHAERRQMHISKT